MDRGRIPVAALLAALACAGAPSGAHAYSVTYDFAGTGRVCDYVDGGAGTRCADAMAFAGAITLAIDERGPSGEDASVLGAGEASDWLGWVTPSFEIAWNGRTFVPQRLAAETGFDTYTIVSDDAYVAIPYEDAVDELYTRFASVRFDAAENAIESVIFRRGTTQLGWLGGLDFADALLAPGDGALNVLEFVSSRDLDPSSLGGVEGFYGAVDLTTFVRRVAAVPEPSPVALGALAVLAVALARRTRTR